MVCMEDVFDQIQAFRETVSACQKKGLVTWVFSGLPLTLRLSKIHQLTLWFCSERPGHSAKHLLCSTSELMSLCYFYVISLSSGFLVLHHT